MSESTANTRIGEILIGKFSQYVSRKVMWQAIGLAVILLIWEIAGRIMGSFFLAPVSEVSVRYVSMISNTDLLSVTLTSLRQMFAGFFIAVVIGIPVGLAMGQSSTVEELLDPWISAFFVTSTAALIPLFIIFFGIEFGFRVALVWVSAQWHIIIEIFEGSKELKGSYSDLANSFGASRLQTYRKIIFPGLVPYVMVALRLGIGRAVKGMVLAEMFVVTGLGGYLLATSQFQSTASTLAVILTIMLIAVILTGVIKQIGKRFAPWYEF